MQTLSMSEAAAILGKSENTVRKLVSSGRLQSQTEVRSGKPCAVVDASEVAAYKAQIDGKPAPSVMDEPPNTEPHEVVSPALSYLAKREDIWQERLNAQAQRMNELERELGRLEGENAGLKAMVAFLEGRGEGKKGKWWWQR